MNDGETVAIRGGVHVIWRVAEPCIAINRVLLMHMPTL